MFICKESGSHYTLLLPPKRLFAYKNTDFTKINRKQIGKDLYLLRLYMYGGFVVRLLLLSEP
jgi:hypothetical protein